MVRLRFPNFYERTSAHTLPLAPIMHRQTAHCMGANSDRPPFNRRGSRSDPSYIPCKSGGQNTFTLYAGEAQGIENGQQFTIHRKIPSESGTPSQPSIGTMQVVKLESTSSQLAFLAGVPKPEKLPKVFYAHPSSSVKQDPSAIYCQDRQLIDAIFPPNVCGQEVKHARYPTQAEYFTARIRSAFVSHVE